MEDAFSQIERIVSFDIGNRGIKNLVCPGDLKNSVREIRAAKNIAVVTGFYVIDASAGETDGPGGAVSLCTGLAALGIKPTIITDELNFDLLEAGLTTNPCNNISLISFPMEHPEETARAIFNKHRFDHLIFIERVGPAEDGHYYNARGNPMTAYTAKMDFLAKEAVRRNVRTTGIGDGGNEIGMGKVFERVRADIPFGERIACTLKTDHLLACGTSNWGAWALLAGLSILENENLLPDKSFEAKLLNNIVSAGAVDAVTKKRALSVDGFPLERHFELLDQLQFLCDRTLIGANSQ